VWYTGTKTLIYTITYYYLLTNHQQKERRKVMPEPVKKPLAGAYYCPEAMPMLLAGYYQDLCKQRKLQQEIDDQQEEKLEPSAEFKQLLKEVLCH